jgi:predicted deacetylase
MNNARYLFRMDDIIPTMDWERFHALLRLFQRYHVKPLLGVVPDNQDPKLDRQSPHPKFWETLNLLVERNAVDIAQHGYRHILERDSQHALLSDKGGRITRRSEFAGYSFHEQFERLQKGKEILRARGITTDFFFAPNHSFDHTTLRALRANGFTAVSDGCGVRPFRERGLIFVPQQLWHPRWMPTGVFTICLHSNEITPSNVRDIRQFLRTPAHITSFSHEVRSYRPQLMDGLNNALFRGLYSSARLLRGNFGGREAATQQPLWSTPLTMGKGSISSI